MPLERRCSISWWSANYPHGRVRSGRGVSYMPIFAENGSVQAISAASLEITREKQAEAALVQSEKLAAVGRLASSISHEINNPLEAITNLLYILSMDEELSTSARGFVKTAQSELARVSQIATQTLRFHRQAVDRTRVTAAELVSSVLNLYQGRLSNSGIAVEAAFASATPIFCYENDIRQVLNNLIANAIDAMRSGGRLVVRAHDASVNRGGRGVRITIADTGHGMSAKTRARIFEPFYTTKDLNGTGLRLWISAGNCRAPRGQAAGAELPRQRAAGDGVYAGVAGVNKMAESRSSPPIRFVRLEVQLELELRGPRRSLVEGSCTASRTVLIKGVKDVWSGDVARSLIR